MPPSCYRSRHIVKCFELQWIFPAILRDTAVFKFPAMVVCNLIAFGILQGGAMTIADLQLGVRIMPLLV